MVDGIRRIIRLNRKYTITDHKKGEKYDITESEPYTDPNGYPIYTKQVKEKSTDELIAEAKALFQKLNVTPVKTKRELELERSTKQWQEYYRNNPSKIRYNIFEEIERAFDY
jgi:hypothetical protein